MARVGEGGTAQATCIRTHSCMIAVEQRDGSCRRYAARLIIGRLRETVVLRENGQGAGG